MALVVETGAGLSNAESYVSVTRIGELLDEIGLGGAWRALDLATQEGRARRATSTIDRENAFRGSLKNEDQSLSFPRVGLYDKDGRVILGIPRVIEEAAAELAFFLKDYDFISDEEASVQEVKVGPIDIKMASSSSSYKKLIPDSIQQKLNLFGSNQTNTGRRMRKIAQ